MVLSSSMHETFTAAGIAERLLEKIGRSGGSSQAELIRMIRHYTGMSLLNPVGEVHTGTGNRRLYPSDAPLRAEILLKLNRFGIPIGVIQKIFFEFDSYLKREFGTDDLIQVCRKLSDPCVFVIYTGERQRDASGFVGYAFIAEEKELTNYASFPLLSIPLGSRIRPVKASLLTERPTRSKRAPNSPASRRRAGTRQ